MPTTNLTQEDLQILVDMAGKYGSLVFLDGARAAVVVMSDNRRKRLSDALMRLGYDADVVQDIVGRV